MRNENGFTLVELLVAMVMGLLIMAALYYTYASQQKSQVITEKVTALQQNCRSAMYHLQKDMRMAGYNPTRSAVTFGFVNVAAATDSVTITMDEDEDGALDTDETITYSLNPDNTLKKVVGAGTPQTIAESITGLNFTFLDANETSTTVDINVRMVDITVTATDGRHNRQMSTRISCRNMGLQ
jgi:type IV pilus assembly protein PilW